MKKRLVSLILALVMTLGLTSGLTAPAYATDSDFIIENGVLKRYVGTSVDVVIPSGVTAIDRYAFFHSEVKVRTADIRSLVIPEGVTEIPDMGFNPSLSLERVTLPNSLVSIGHNAFSDAERLTELRLPDGLKTIGYGAFSNCTSLTTVYIPDSVTEIGTGAFSGCTSLVNVRIPSTASLGTGTFRDAPWLENQGNSNGGLVIVGDTLVGNSFSYRDQIGHLEIPQGIRVIAGQALDFLSMTSVTIPEGVEEIGSRAFEGCTKLTEVKLPSTIKVVDFNAFSGCTGLTEVTFPASVTQVGDVAFDGCTNLKTATFLGKNTEVGNGAFPLTTTIRGLWGSGAERYANYSFVPFESLDGSAPEQVVVPKESPVVADPNAKAAETTNAGAHNYNGNWAETIKSYLYQRQDGNLTRVEWPKGYPYVVVEVYDKNFKLLTHNEIPTELSIWGGFFAGENYNFLIFGDGNSTERNEESLQKEVFRVVKYSKDWERLDSWSGRGMNTVTPFDAATVRCDEKDGILTVRTGKTQFRTGDGLCHQTNLTFSIRQSDMTQAACAGASSFSFVSHSFNQFVLIEEDGVMATLDHGDGNPRAFVVNIHPDYRRGVDSADITFGRTDAASVEVTHFPSFSSNLNVTGAQAGGFEASKTHYIVSAQLRAGVGTNGNAVGDEGIMVYTVDKQTRAVTKYQLATANNLSSGETLSNTQMMKFSDDKFLVMWEIKVNGENSRNTIYFTFLDGTGKPVGSVMTAQAYLSDCKPILVDGKAVWYATGTTWEQAPTFYTMDASGSLATSAVDPSLLPSPWAREQVSEATGLGLVPFNVDGFFTEAISRSMFCDIADTVYIKSGAPAITATAKFGDSSDPAVERMATVGVVKGVGNNRFDPYGELTREQAATMLYRLAAAAGKPFPDVAASFADKGDISSWASKEVGAVQAAGIMNGVGDNRFDPKGSYTYEQSIVTMLRMYHYLNQ